ncbi:hypothetical protein HPB52_018369 [Rhipicephalus sanguineus]|uniref:Uncharacterized protein n=1 Tax=Rhipicephalus sanguineus TaxID=34632 RepID=A0A9D4SYY4_RHISA|nr:hypothetical protein HPB52_018369 [Rhipicephalus sanguineus]
MRDKKKGDKKKCEKRPEGPCADSSAERKRRGLSVFYDSFRRSRSKEAAADDSTWKSSGSFLYAHKPEQVAGGLCPLSASYDIVALPAGYRAGAPLAARQGKQLIANKRRSIAWDRLSLSLVSSKRIEAAETAMLRRKYSLDLAMDEEDVPKAMKALASACDVSGGVATLPRLKKSQEDLTKRSWLDLRAALQRKISNRLRRSPSLPVMEGGRSLLITDDDDVSWA